VALPARQGDPATARSAVTRGPSRSQAGERVLPGYVVLWFQCLVEVGDDVLGVLEADC